MCQKHGCLTLQVPRAVPGSRYTSHSALFDHGLASKFEQRFASVQSIGNLTFLLLFNPLFASLTHPAGTTGERCASACQDRIGCCRVLHQPVLLVYRKLAHHDSTTLSVRSSMISSWSLHCALVSGPRPRPSRVNTCVFLSCFSQMP